MALMARPPITAPGKDDDDSWGKLASDLLGIQLDVDAAFDFPEPEPVVQVAPITSTEEAPPVVEVPAQPAETPEITEPTPLTSDDEFWKVLEEWDWDESGNKPKGRPRTSTEGEATERSSKHDTRRPDRGERDDRRGGRSRGGRDRDKEVRRSPVGESRGDEFSAGIEAAVEKEVPRRRTESKTSSGRDQEDSSRTRADTPRREPPRRSVAKSRPTTDGFGDGIDDEDLLEDPWAQADEEVLTTSSPEDVDIDEFGEDDTRDVKRTSRGETSETSELERPRRRRRRRGGRTGRKPEEATAERLPPDEDLDDELLEPAETALNDEEESAVLDDEQPARSRRRRRGGRGTRRSNETRERSEDTSTNRESRPPLTRSVEDDSEFDEAHDAEPPVVRIKYENIPTWEEAISVMLVRRDQGSRSRGPQRPQQRRGDW